ncbi:flagellar hook protein FlgE [Bacillus sp. S13(2024)]|uniref:flagellar hook protein FlgE n=1 Tax=unclassified Bacillus (in: firmicutes) TaxID=185979 RepID=UPI003D229D87
MIKALYTSITGMNAMQNALSITSNNIANAQTVGYKKQKAVFDDLLYNNTIGSRGDANYAGTNPKSIGNGVKLSGTYTDYSDGSITLTGGKTQTAIEGNGFFVLGDSRGGNVQYTRKGTFGISEDYYITNSEGQYVLAYPTKAGTDEIDFSGSPQPIRIPMGTAVGGVRSDKATMGGNIPRDPQQITQDFPVSDAEGNSLTMRVEMTPGKDAQGKLDGSYTYRVLVNDPKDKQNFKELVNNKKLTFDNLGELSAIDGAAVQRDPVTNKITNGTVNIPFGAGLDLDLSGLTNYPTDKTLATTNITGRPATTVKDCMISDGGYVMVKYADGSSRAAGQLAVAMFPNEGGLMKTGNGNYEATTSAGNPSLGVSGQNGSGKVRGGAQEGSNVDLSVEFVDLMLYQRGFQGNAKVIKVADDVLNEIVNLIR